MHVLTHIWSVANRTQLQHLNPLTSNKTVEKSGHMCYQNMIQRPFWQFWITSERSLDEPHPKSIILPPSRAFQDCFDWSYVHELRALNWKRMLFCDHVLDPYRSHIILKVWMCGAWILRFGNYDAFVFQISGDWRKVSFFPKGPATLKIWELKWLLLLKNMRTLASFLCSELELKNNAIHCVNGWINEWIWMKTKSDISTNYHLCSVKTPHPTKQTWKFFNIPGIWNYNFQALKFKLRSFIPLKLYVKGQDPAHGRETAWCSM